MIKIYSGVSGALMAIAATVAPAQSLQVDPARQRMCSTLGLAFQNSAAISDEDVETLHSRGTSGEALDAFLAPMKAGAKRLRDTGNALEQRYGKVDTPEQIAEAKALSQKPLKPMRELSVECLK